MSGLGPEKADGRSIAPDPMIPILSGSPVAGLVWAERGGAASSAARRNADAAATPGDRRESGRGRRCRGAAGCIGTSWGVRIRESGSSGQVYRTSFVHVNPQGIRSASRPGRPSAGWRGVPGDALQGAFQPTATTTMLRAPLNRGPRGPGVTRTHRTRGLRHRGRGSGACSSGG